MENKIVLFQPNPFSATRPYSNAPLALLGISKLLAKENYLIRIITPVTHKNFLKTLIEESKNSICLGITAMTGYSIHEGLMVSRAIKKINPEIPVVWGGWHPSILPLETVENKNIDIVVKGQGERTFYEIIKAIQFDSDFNNILGIAYKNKKGEINETPNRPLENLDNFPPIPYHLIDIEKFINPITYGKRWLFYYTSYGCPHRCYFCVEPIVNKRRWVGLSPSRMVEEIIDMKNKYRIDSVAIIDSNFFINEKRTREFAEELINKKVNIKIGNLNGRPSELSRYSKKTWQLMKDSGFSQILVGAESGDNETLEYMRKDATIEDTIKLTELCAEFNIKILSSFLAGFPRENDPEKCYYFVEKEIASSFSLIERMLKIYPYIRMMFALYLPYPSSSLFEQSKKLGLELPNGLEDWNEYLIAAEDATKIKVRQSWITKEQARRILMASIYIFFFLDPDSFDLVTDKIKNKLIKKFLFIAFQIFKGIANFRWKNKFFKFPIDFYIYNILRKYSKLG